MPTWIKRWFQSPVFEDEEKTRVARMLNAILWAVIATLIVRIATIAITNPGGASSVMGINGAVIVLTLGMIYLLRAGHVRLVAAASVSVLWLVVSVTNFLFGGVRGVGYSSNYLILILAAGLLLSGRASILGATASAALGTVLYYLEINERVTPDVSTLEIGPMFSSVTPRFFIIALFVYLFHRSFTEALARARHNEQKLSESNETMRTMQTSLEKRVAERTANLQAAAFVAREAAAIHDTEQLLKATVQLIAERFDLYYAGIFLLDEAGQYAILRAASLGGGQRMLEQRHRMPVGRGMVGSVAVRGKHLIALEVDVDTEFVPNPNLPDTRSEMALPLLIRERVIGVLDVQSIEPQAFSEDNVSVLQMLADQIALALDNAQLFQRVQESLETERRISGALGADAWAKIARSRPELNQRYDPLGILPDDQQWRAEMKQALDKGETIVSQSATADAQTSPRATLSIPLKPRADISIGVLDAHAPEGVTWTQDEIAALETLAEQLAVALDSARLYEDSRRRAAYQQMTREIADNIRSATSVEQAIQRAVQDMGHALGTSEIVARIGTQRDLLAPDLVASNGNTQEKEGPA
jgi:GAF domain-containing protein